MYSFLFIRALPSAHTSMLEFRVVRSRTARDIANATAQWQFSRENSLIATFASAVLLLVIIGSAHFVASLFVRDPGQFVNAWYALIIFACVVFTVVGLLYMIGTGETHGGLRHETKDTVALLCGDAPRHMTEPIARQLDALFIHLFKDRPVRFAFDSKHMAKCASEYFRDVNKRITGRLSSSELKRWLARHDEECFYSTHQPLKIFTWGCMSFNATKWWVIEVSTSTEGMSPNDEKEELQQTCTCSNATAHK